MKLNHTQELENAIIAATDARDGRGLHVHLCNLHNAREVAGRIQEMAEWFNLGGTFVHGQPAAEAAARNIKLLATVLHEHIRAKNFEI